MQIPKFNQININTGVGKGAVIDRKHLIGALFTLEFITGQKPSITRAKKSIDKFKLREKMLIGCKVTLRKKKMFFFLDRLINLVLSDHGSSDFIYNHRLARQRQESSNFDHCRSEGAKTVCSPEENLQGSARAWFGLPYPPARSLSQKKSSVFSRCKREKEQKRAPRGISHSEIAFGIKDAFIFKELPYVFFDFPYGMNISICTQRFRSSGRFFEKKNPALKGRGQRIAPLTDSFQMP